MLDSQFCQRRLLPGEGGFLLAKQAASGQWQFFFTTSPDVAIESFTAIQNSVFGKILIQGSDGVMRAMTGPAVADLVLRTLANGDVVFAALPPTTVPDPLTVVTANVTTLNVAGVATFNGIPIFNNLNTEAIVQVLGLNAVNQLVVGTPATTGVQTCMFYQQATSPGPGLGPNDAANPGDMLTIGNLLFDSVVPVVPGGSLVTVTNSQTLTVVTEGTYLINWGGEVSYGGGGHGTPSINLMINGVQVNRGYARGGYGGLDVTTALSMAGFEARGLDAGTTIQLQLDAASGNNSHTYEVRISFTRTGPKP